MASQIDISREPDTTGWQTGTASIRGATYSVALKRSARPSGFGIDNGRIFKLEITTPRGRRAVDYDRGWFACPKDGPDAEVFEAVLAAFNGPDHEGG
jgi:hypothetical protein